LVTALIMASLATLMVSTTLSGPDEGDGVLDRIDSDDRSRSAHSTSRLGAHLQDGPGSARGLVDAEQLGFDIFRGDVIAGLEPARFLTPGPALRITRCHLATGAARGALADRHLR